MSYNANQADCGKISDSLGGMTKWVSNLLGNHWLGGLCPLDNPQSRREASLAPPGFRDWFSVSLGFAVLFRCYSPALQPPQRNL